MNIYARRYIYERSEWPDLVVDEKTALPLLCEIRFLQGKQVGKLEALGFEVREDAMLNAITSEVVKSSEVEGEILDENKVRSSVARKLGIAKSGLIDSTRDIDYIVEMMLDATQNYNTPLSEARLLGWQASLFPAGRRGIVYVKTGEYRDDIMQVVSGALGKETIHFQAPPPERVKPEMDLFLKWLSSPQIMDPIILAALAHFRFVTIHPFDDGNGRIARAIAEMMLARADASSFRYYSMSAGIMAERKQYYNVLEETQNYSGNINEWIEWFLGCLLRSIQASEEALSKVLRKANFWDRYRDLEINTRQRLILNKLLDGFEGKLQTSKWAKIAKCSNDTALRDIEDLVQKGILIKSFAGGRSTSYDLI
jgi:Fic family protein